MDTNQAIRPKAHAHRLQLVGASGAVLKACHTERAREFLEIDDFIEKIRHIVGISIFHTDDEPEISPGIIIRLPTPYGPVEGWLSQEVLGFDSSTTFFRCIECNKIFSQQMLLGTDRCWKSRFECQTDAIPLNVVQEWDHIDYPTHESDYGENLWLRTAQEMLGRMDEKYQLKELAFDQPIIVPHPSIASLMMQTLELEDYRAPTSWPNLHTEAEVHETIELYRAVAAKAAANMRQIV